MKRVVLISVLLALVLSACGSAVDKLYCPINYKTNAVACQVGGTNPDIKQFEELAALRLEQNEVGVFNPPGDAAPVIVKDIASNSVPAKYSLVYPTVRQTYRTIGSPIDANGNFQGCTEHENSNKLCATPLSEVRLKGGVFGTVDYEVDFTVVVDETTAPILAKLQYGFADLVKSLDGYSRTEFRRANEVDPASYTDGSMDGLLQAKYTSLMASWEYARTGVVIVNEVRVRKTSVQGYEAQATDIQGEQGERQAEAFATQTVIACGSFQEEAYKAYCMAVYVWSLKDDGSNPPPPPANYTPITPSPSTTVVP